MSSQAAKAALVDALKQLRRRFDVIRRDWDDDTAKRFQAEVLETIEQQAAAAIKGFDQAGELISAVRRECADD
ncbi:MAG: hypothetical protein KF864_01970 [Phycisphaeraceae bacterium]|nr:hypothetical protein [Phycisphaeraceae bacterium]